MSGEVNNIDRPIVFVYAKNGRIKVLSESEGEKLHSECIKDGWHHTATLDPCAYIQYLMINKYNINVLAEIESLSKEGGE